MTNSEKLFAAAEQLVKEAHIARREEQLNVALTQLGELYRTLPTMSGYAQEYALTRLNDLATYVGINK